MALQRLSAIFLSGRHHVPEAACVFHLPKHNHSKDMFLWSDNCIYMDELNGSERSIPKAKNREVANSNNGTSIVRDIIQPLNNDHEVSGNVKKVCNIK